jgi:GDPmannose 4,6-dehydratase
LLCRIAPDEIYHLGAQSHVRVSFDILEYTGDITALGTTRLLDAIRETGSPARFYNAASSEMFGQAYACPQTETTPFRPRSPYGCAKLYSYWMTVNAREGCGLYAVNGILFNHESPRRGEVLVSSKTARAVARILHGMQEKLYLGNLDGEHDWRYAPEFVEGIWKMLRQDDPEDFLLATGETHSVREFVERAFAEVVLDWRRDVEVDPQYYRPTEIDCLEGDSSKARKKLGWAPLTKFRDLVKIMVEADVQLQKTNGAAKSSGDARRRIRALDNGNAAMGVFHGRHIAVTGGAGFLGRVVVRKLRERGCTDITVPRRASCDLSRWDNIEQLYDKYRPHLLLHRAATVDSPAGHPDVAESFYNVMMATQLMEASSRHGVEKMICIGSASSYPANAPEPLREPGSGARDSWNRPALAPYFKRRRTGGNMASTGCF